MIRVLLAICVAPTAGAQLTGTADVLGFVSAFEWFLEAFAAVSLTMSVMLFFYVSARHQRAEQDLHQRLNASATTNAELRQENDELALTIKQLQQTIAGLS
ncbi:MAG: FtsB/FtsL family cell division protein [Planctomycetota bacterium]